MCAPNKTKKGNKAFSYQFRTHLLITISVMVSGRLSVMSKMEVFLHQAWIACQWIALLRCSTILTNVNNYQHIADNNFFSFSKTAHWHILYATQSKPLNFTFSDLWP